MAKDTIEFEAEVYKVQTLVDGGIRLTLDLPESGAEIMGELAICQQNGIILQVTVKEWQGEGRGRPKM